MTPLVFWFQNSDDMASERESVTYANVRSVSAETMLDTLNCSVVSVCNTHFGRRSDQMIRQVQLKYSNDNDRWGGRI